MARLTAKVRASLPKSTFAGPHRSFPMPDKNHARAALQDLNRAKGLSRGQKETIKARADRMLDIPRSGYHGTK